MRLTKSLRVLAFAGAAVPLAWIGADAGAQPLRRTIRADAPVLSVQAKPNSDPPTDVAPPPAALPDTLHPDDKAPLTPDIRPPRAAPSPDAKPDRKAEPQPGPTPPQKEARPAPKAAPKGDPKASQTPHGATGQSATKQPAKDKPGLAVAQPRTPAERDKALSDLYAYLATAEDAKQAATVSASIERLWVTPGSDTINLLMQRALQAHNGKDSELALKLLDAVVGLAPDYAEGWNRRAYIHYTQNDIELALGDLRRTLALDPNHFKALDGLIHILKDIGRKKEALQAARRLLDVNPYYDGAQQLVDELARELEGRGI